MKAQLKADSRSPSTYTVKIQGTMTGNLHKEYLDTKSWKYSDNDEFEEDEVIDDFLPEKIKAFIPRLIKDFQEKTGISVSGWEDYETENYPRNEEDTKNINIKFTIELQCDIDHVMYSHSSDLI